MAKVPLPESVCDVATRIAGRNEEIERERRLPADIVEALTDSGIFRACVPARYHGREERLEDILEAVELLAYHDGSVGWCAMIGATTGVLSAYLPEPWAEEIYGSDPRTVTGGHAEPRGRARLVDGGLSVSGRWQWASGIQHCHWIGGGCTLVDGDGRPSPSPEGLRAPFVLFPAAEVEIIDTWHVAGLRGTGSNDFQVSELFVPTGRWVQLGIDPPRVDGPLYRFPFFALLALGVTSVSLGLARRAYEQLVDLAAHKRPAGSTRTLAERPVVQAQVAEAEAAFRSAKALLREVLGAAWAAAEAGDALSGEHRRQLRLAATNATMQSARAVDLMYHAGGGTSVYETSALQRVFRDIHVATQHAMVAPRTLEVLGRLTLGLPTDTGQL